MAGQGIRSILEIGALWPRCKSCGHIAQCHDTHECHEVVTGQCHFCGTWTNNAKCKCTGYVGPTWEEFKRDYLRPEEIKYYHYDEVVK